MLHFLIMDSFVIHFQKTELNWYRLLRDTKRKGPQLYPDFSTKFQFDLDARVFNNVSLRACACYVVK